MLLSAATGIESKDLRIYTSKTIPSIERDFPEAVFAAFLRLPNTPGVDVEVEVEVETDIETD